MKTARLLILLPAATALFALSCHSLDKQAAPAGEAYLDLPATPYDYTASTFRQSIDSINQQATLGRVLFYDRHLSVNNSISCGSCHQQTRAFADNAAQSLGVASARTGRNTPALQNLTFSGMFFSPGGGITTGGGFRTGGSLFWDGRETDLQKLISRPISNHVEMGIGNFDELVAKLDALPYYSALFEKAYGTREVTMDRVSNAVAAFVSALNAVNTRFDQHHRDGAPFTALEEEGEMLFTTKYNCGSCHNENVNGYFSGSFANTGLDLTPTDKGLGTITARSADIGRFKVPNLRNVALTAPYMHDGRFKTLSEVIEHYNTGMQPAATLDERLKTMDGKPMRMGITPQEKEAIIAFLGTLTDVDLITNPAFSDPFKTK